MAEDEPFIRLLAIDVLVSAGFAVLEAAHAEAALAFLHAQASDIHALFTDIRMPGALDGLALAHHARQHFPWMAIVIASGDALPAEADLPEGSHFLAKPYDPDHVVTSIHTLIKQRQPYTNDRQAQA